MIQERYTGGATICFAPLMTKKGLKQRRGVRWRTTTWDGLCVYWAFDPILLRLYIHEETKGDYLKFRERTKS